jgi:hypothetical protein
MEDCFTHSYAFYIDVHAFQAYVPNPKSDNDGSTEVGVLFKIW